MAYTKSIQVMATGMVVVKVFEAASNRCVGVECFTALIPSNAKVERLCEKAHKWADERIALCEQYERGVPCL